MKDFYKSIPDPLKLHRKIEKLLWVIRNNNTYYDAYLYDKTEHGKIKNKGVILSINNQTKSEAEIDTKELTHFIPDNHKLFYIDYSIKNNF